MRERLKEAPFGTAKLRADEQKHHLRRRSEARWPNASKPSDLKTTVNDAVAQGRFMSLIWGGPTLRDLFCMQSVTDQ